MYQDLYIKIIKKHSRNFVMHLDPLYPETDASGIRLEAGLLQVISTTLIHNGKPLEYYSVQRSSTITCFAKEVYVMTD